ncbi:MAG TPA: type II secretion system protein N [Oxalicibacterium sp.]|jgi:general secretion pathway protein C|nr:type II secretion system protein N [Oxalicibacterium sp.]
MKKIAFQLPTTPKRFAAIVLLAVAILASIVYWILRLRTAEPAPVAIAIAATAPVSATTALFGDSADMLPSAANLSITGVIVAPDPQDSIAIVVEAGQRARALRVGAAISAGLRLTEVHPRYIVVSDGERSTRVALPARAAQAQGEDANTEAAPAATPAPETEGGQRGEPPHRSGDQEGGPQASAPPDGASGGEPPDAATTQ